MSQALVLLVDDDDSSLDMLERRLRRAGYAVLTAVDGEEAVAEAADKLPDIVLMDKRLPRLDGYTAVRALRGNSRTREIPVICLTADATPEDEQAAIEAGCQHFMAKPVEFAVLLAVMESLLGAAASGG